MKKQFMFVLSVLLFSLSLSFPAQPVLIENRLLSFGGTYDMFRGIVIDENNNIFVNGYKSVLGKTQAALGKLSASNSGFEWIILDSDSTSSTQNELACLEQNYLAWFRHGRWSGNGILSKINTEKEEVWKKETPFYSLTSVRDTIVALSYADKKILFIDGKNGETLREFSINRKSYSATIRANEDYTWIFAMCDDTGKINCSAYAQMYNLNGQMVWENFVHYGIGVFGDIDEYGNAYFGGSKAVYDDPQGWLKYFIMKINPEGTILWQREWFEHQEYESNYENWVNGVIVSPDNNQAILYGHTERSETKHTGNFKDTYVFSFKTANGDSLWKMRWESFPVDYYVRDNGIEGAAFDSQGNLFLIGKTYDGNIVQPYLLKYAIGVVGVKDKSSSTPNKLFLCQNYPNPFNSQTTIEYSLPKDAQVKIVICNMLGQEVEVIVNEHQKAGQYSLKWNAENVPSGVYFALLETCSQVLCKKMIYLK